VPAFAGLLKDCEAEVRAAAAGKVKGTWSNNCFLRWLVTVSSSFQQSSFDVQYHQLYIN